MEKNKRLITSLVTVAAGLVIKINSGGHLGQPLQNLPFTLWPILFVFIGLDLLFSYRRLVGSVVLFFTAAALIGSSTTGFKLGKDLWNLFQGNWPLLIILYGVDSLFNSNGSKKLMNTGVIVCIMLTAFFTIFSSLKIELPEGMDLQNIFKFERDHGGQVQPPSEGFEPAPETEAKSFGINKAPVTHRIDTALPSDGPVQLEISASGGKFSIRGSELMGRLLYGQIDMNPGEEFLEDSTQTDGVNLYRLTAQGKADVNSAVSNWDLALNASAQTMLNIDLKQGYLKADLSNLSLISASLTNEYGSMDVLAPTRSLSDIVLTCYNGDVRVYYLEGSGVALTFHGTSQINIPDEYARTGNLIQPRDYKIEPISMEVNVNGGSVTVLPYK